MIPGLTLLEDFVTPEDETLILQQVPPTPPRAAVTERNSVRRYGSQSVYRTGILEKSIPGSLSDICVRLFKEKILGYVPHSVTVNEYQRGQLIPPAHRRQKMWPGDRRAESAVEGKNENGKPWAGESLAGSAAKKPPADEGRGKIRLEAFSGTRGGASHVGGFQEGIAPKNWDLRFLSEMTIISASSSFLF